MAAIPRSESLQLQSCEEAFQAVLHHATKEEYDHLSFVDSWRLWAAEYLDRQVNDPAQEGRTLSHLFLSHIQKADKNATDIQRSVVWYGHRVGMAVHYVYRNDKMSRQHFAQGFAEVMFSGNARKVSEAVLKVLFSQDTHTSQAHVSSTHKSSLSAVQDQNQPVAFEKIDALAAVLLAHPEWYEQEGAFRVDDGCREFLTYVEELLRENPVDAFEAILLEMKSRTRIDREYLTVLKRLIRATQGPESQRSRVSDAEFFRRTPNLTLLFRKIASCPATLMDKKNLKITFTKLMGAVSEEYWDMVFREQRTPCWCQTL